MKRDDTSRGFRVYTDTDRYGHGYSLQESSLATEQCIWLGLDDAKPQVLASQAAEAGVETGETTGWVDYPVHENVLMHTRMHLTREQVAQMLPLLQYFVDHGRLP